MRQTDRQTDSYRTDNNGACCNQKFELSIYGLDVSAACTFYTTYCRSPEGDTAEPWRSLRSLSTSCYDCCMQGLTLHRTLLLRDDNASAIYATAH